ncbi:unnamed protein product, partial [Symbiodinium sp. CCMP2456]
MCPASKEEGPQMSVMFSLVSRVTCGIPLIIMDSRHHDLIEQDWDADNPGLEGKFDFADMSMQEAVRKLTNLGKALN